MENFSVNIDGKEYWISRSVAACGFIFKKIMNTIYCLVEKRGNGAADFKGYWCVPCGYLDYDETLHECIKREVKEECGFICDISKLKMVGINSSPKTNRQNVTAHFIYEADIDENFNLYLRTGGEKDEISRVDWLPIASIDSDGEIKPNETLDIKWAFNHDNLIKKYVKYYGKEKNFNENFV